MKKFFGILIAALTAVCAAAQDGIPRNNDGTPATGFGENVMSIQSLLDAAKAPADSVRPGPLTAADLFVSAPTEVIPSIDRSTRLDMIDYFNAGSQRPSKNQFGGDCAITAMTPEQLTFTTSAVGETTISLLEHGGKPLVMLITTVKTPGEDSQVRFFDAAWKPVKKGLFIVPTLDDWTREEARDKRADLENGVPFMLVKMSYDPGRQNLTLTNNVGAYLPDEVKELAGSSLRGSLTYHWNGKRFSRL